MLSFMKRALACPVPLDSGLCEKKKEQVAYMRWKSSGHSSSKQKEAFLKSYKFWVTDVHTRWFSGQNFRCWTAFPIVYSFKIWKKYICYLEKEIEIQYFCEYFLIGIIESLRLKSSLRSLFQPSTYHDHITRPRHSVPPSTLFLSISRVGDSRTSLGILS